MAQLSRRHAREIQKEKLPLANDRFHVAAQQIQDEHVSNQVPRPVVQESGGKELPSVGRVNAAIAQSQVFADEPRLIGVEKNLRDKRDDIQPDQAEQNYARALRPAPGERRRFSAGQAHVTRVSQ